MEKTKLIKWAGDDKSRPVELVKLHADNTIQIGSPQTLEFFPLKIYVGGVLLIPSNACKCGACELLRSIPTVGN